MSRILFFGLLAYFAVFLFKRRKAPFNKQADDNPPREKSINQFMVQCASCGLHIPQSEALLHHQKMYCCEDHVEKN